VNPLAAILSAGMMLEFLGLEPAAKAMDQAVAATLERGEALPADLGGSATTRQVTDAVLKNL
jgi:isocitrate/isopropylmalate dehydrogenase